MPKKSDWVISTGTKYCTYYYHCIKNKTEEELGKYIACHVDKLMGHFEHIFSYIQNCTENGDKITNKLHILLAPYCHIIDIETADEYNEIVANIELALADFSGQKIFDNFFYRNDLSYTSINKLMPHIGQSFKN